MKFMAYEVPVTRSHMTIMMLLTFSSKACLCDQTQNGLTDKTTYKSVNSANKTDDVIELTTNN